MAARSAAGFGSSSISTLTQLKYCSASDQDCLAYLSCSCYLLSPVASLAGCLFFEVDVADFSGALSSYTDY